MSLSRWTRVHDHRKRAIDPLAEIAHDLEQPLATIRALVASLKAAEVSPAGLRWHLDNMEEQVDHLGAMVRASLAIVVGDPDGDPLEDVSFVEANSSVAAAVRSFAVTWTGRIATSFGEEAFVPAPAGMLHRSVRNVLANAGRAAGDHGAIVVSVNTSPDGTSIAIEDDGPGFGALPARHSIGLEIVDRTMLEAGGSLEIGTSDLLGGACVALSFPRIWDEVSIPG
jgi:signal transduction histidine kinase